MSRADGMSALRRLTRRRLPARRLGGGPRVCDGPSRRRPGERRWRAAIAGSGAGDAARRAAGGGTRRRRPPTVDPSARLGNDRVPRLRRKPDRNCDLSDSDRVARMYVQRVTPERAARFTIDAERFAKLLGQARSRYAVIGHSQTSARTKRSDRQPVKASVVTLSSVLLAVLAAGLFIQIPSAAADGDPASDVLVYQPLFLGSDAGIPVSDQVGLGRLVDAAGRNGFQIRVAIIATSRDLGSITQLWRKPQAYARFLGFELSLAYTGRLLVVMPNGFGLNWSGHRVAAADRTLNAIAIRPGSVGLAAAADTAVRSLAAAAHIRLAPSGETPSASAKPVAIGSGNAVSGSSLVRLAVLVAAALAAASAVALLARRRLRLRSSIPHLRPPKLRRAGRKTAAKARGRGPRGRGDSPA